MHQGTSTRGAPFHSKLISEEKLIINVFLALTFLLWANLPGTHACPKLQISAEGLHCSALVSTVALSATPIVGSW